MMVFVSYFSVKAMMLLVDCKYKVLGVIYQYENLTEDFKDGKESKIQISPKLFKSSEKVKCVNGKNYVELKCEDGNSDEESNNNRDSRASSGSSSPSSRPSASSSAACSRGA